VAGRIPHQTITINTALSSARQRLADISETAALDARVLLAHLLNKDKSWLLAHPEAPLSRSQAAALNNAVKLLQSGAPLPYLLGEWEFFGLSFVVTPDVLIPRPETELLVETALDWIKESGNPVKAAEAGTGSGCIAVSLAVNAANLHLTATDISPKAIEIAQRNADRHHVSNQISFLENDLLLGLTGPYELICANLPYIPTETLGNLDVSRHEPETAMDGGEDGLDHIRRLLPQAANLLSEEGLLLMEIEADQGKAVKRLAAEAFPEAGIQVKSDLANKDRLLVVHT